MKKLSVKSHQFTISQKQGLRLSAIFLIGLFAFCALVAVNTTGAEGENDLIKAQAAQKAITGNWAAGIKGDKVSVNVSTEPEDGLYSSTVHVALDALEGLSAQQVASSAKTNVNFKLRREAGTVTFNGYFQEGKGAGAWTFVSNPSFVSAMRGRGNPTEKELFIAAVENLNTKLVEALKLAGYDGLSFGELLNAAMFNLTPEFIGAWRAAGFDNLSFDRISQLALHRVTPEYIGEMKNAGYENLTLDQLTEARMFRLDSRFVKEAETLGFGRLPFRMAVRMRTFDITPEFIRKWRVAGFDGLSLEDFIHLGTFKVTPEFLNEIKAEGFPQISPREAAKLKILGVNGDFIRRVKAKGFTDVTLRQLGELRTQGIIK